MRDSCERSSTSWTLIVESIRQNHGQVIVWTDVDIQFFASFVQPVRDLMARYDMCYQAENVVSAGVNTGFTALRCSNDVGAFFERVRRTVVESGWNEQPVVNELLATDQTDGLRVGRFPPSFYAGSHGEPPDDLILHHANGTMPQEHKTSLQLKRDQLHWVRGLQAESLRVAPRPDRVAHGRATQADRGCVFFNFGTKCLSMLLVALFTLRQHYDGAITVFLSDVPDRGQSALQPSLARSRLPVVLSSRLHAQQP